MLHQAEVKSSRSMELAEPKLMAAIEPKTEIEAMQTDLRQYVIRMLW